MPQPPQPGPEDLLTVAQAAEWLQLSPAVLRRQVAAQRIPAMRVTATDLRFHVRTVVAHLASHHATCPIPATPGR